MDSIEKLPIIYNFLYIRIKNNNNNNFIGQSTLLEIIRRALVKQGGVPRFLAKYIIDDMVQYKLLEKINPRTYKLIENPKEKRLRFLINSY